MSHRDKPMPTEGFYRLVSDIAKDKAAAEAAQKLAEQGETALETQYEVRPEPAPEAEPVPQSPVEHDNITLDKIAEVYAAAEQPSDDAMGEDDRLTDAVSAQQQSDLSIFSSEPSDDIISTMERTLDSADEDKYFPKVDSVDEALVEENSHPRYGDDKENTDLFGLPDEVGSLDGLTTDKTIELDEDFQIEREIEHMTPGAIPYVPGTPTIPPGPPVKRRDLRAYNKPDTSEKSGKFKRPMHMPSQPPPGISASSARQYSAIPKDWQNEKDYQRLSKQYGIPLDYDEDGEMTHDRFLKLVTRAMSQGTLKREE